MYTAHPKANQIPVGISTTKHTRKTYVWKWILKSRRETMKTIWFFMHFSSFHFWVENFYSKGMFIRRVLSLHLRIISHLLYDLEPSLSSRWLGSSPMDHMRWSRANLDSSRRLQKESVTIIVEFYMTLSLTQHQFEVLPLPTYDKTMTRFKNCNKSLAIRQYNLASLTKFKVQRKQVPFSETQFFRELRLCWINLDAKTLIFSISVRKSWHIYKYLTGSSSLQK